MVSERMVTMDRSLQSRKLFPLKKKKTPKTKHEEGSWRRYSFGQKRKKDVARRDVPKERCLMHMAGRRHGKKEYIGMVKLL